MLKKKVTKNFRISLLLGIGIFLTTYSLAQENFKKDKCYLLADGKKVQLFSNLATIRKIILVSRNIEYLDTKIFAYWYDAKIKNFNKYLITPQIVFFVDTATKKTIKEELFYSIERDKVDGNIKKASLKNIIELIKRQNIPFLEIIKNPDFGTSYKFDSTCHPYEVEISKISNEHGGQEFTIKILLYK